MGKFRYFDADDVNFNDGPLACFVTATISKLPESIAKDEAFSGLHCIGEVLNLIPIGDPEALPTSITHKLAWVTALGPVATANPETSSFTMTIDQWTPFLSKDPNAAASVSYPAICTLPDKAKWKKKKPMPDVNAVVHIDGFLTGFTTDMSGRESDDNADHPLTSLMIEIEHVFFAGRSSTRRGSPVPHPTAPVRASAAQRLRFSYGNKSELGGSAGATKENVAGSESPLSNRPPKRPRMDSQSSGSDLASSPPPPAILTGNPLSPVSARKCTVPHA